MRPLVSTIAFWAGVLVTPAGAATRHVPSEYATINAGLDASVPGDTVLVAPGTYTDHETRSYPFGFITSVGFLRGGVTLRSEAGAETTVLRMDDTYFGGPAICSAYLEAGTITVEGFTFSGLAESITALDTPRCERVVLKECVFRDLGAGGGGVPGVGCTRCNLEVYGCRFENILGGGGGAGINQTSSTLRIEDCEFRNVRSGAMALHYDTVYPHAAGLTMRRCRFFDNEKTNGSGGAVSVGYPQVLIEDCWFENNRSVGSSNGGGALSFGGATTNSRVLRDCTFVNNWVTTGKSGGVRVLSGSLEASGNTFIGNHQEIDWETGGSSVYLVGVNFDFRNNVIVGSTGDQAVGISSGTLATSCNVYWNNPLGHTSGFALDATDLVVDPLFCAPAAADFHVDSTSLCLPRNNPSCGELIGAWEQGCGTVSVESESWGRIKERYRALPEETKP